MDERDDVSDGGSGLFPPGVGERLRAAREAAGLDLNDVATRTRVPMRHLQALERGDYAALPSPTYALGFGRAFARAVGADERDIARDLRVELGRAPLDAADATPYEPSDPARLPSRLLAWSAAAVAVVLLIGYLWISRERFAPTPPLVATVETPAPPAAVSPLPEVAPPADRGVVLTATAPVWVRVYDRQDRVLLEKELASGESYRVPGDADTPMIRTGRAESITVTVGGRAVAPLGPPERTVRDVVLTAPALEARAEALPSGAAPATSAATDTQ